MNAIHEFHAAFLIQLDNKTDPSRVTDLLGINPTRSSAKSDPRKSPFNVWSLESKLNLRTGLEKHLDSILNQIGPLRKEIHAVKRHLKPLYMALRCGHMTNYDNGFCEGPILSSASLSRIGDLGMPLQLETYAGTKFDEGILRGPGVSHGSIAVDRKSFFSQPPALPLSKTFAFSLEKTAKEFIVRASLGTTRIGRYLDRNWLAFNTLSNLFPARAIPLEQQLEEIFARNTHLRQQPLSIRGASHADKMFWIIHCTKSSHGFCGTIEIAPSALKKFPSVAHAVCLENWNLRK